MKSELPLALPGSGFHPAELQINRNIGRQKLTVNASEGGGMENAITQRR